MFDLGFIEVPHRLGVYAPRGSVERWRARMAVLLDPKAS